MSVLIKSHSAPPPPKRRASDFPAGTYLRQIGDPSFVVLVAHSEGGTKRAVLLRSGTVCRVEDLYAAYEPVSRIEIDQEA